MSIELQHDLYYFLGSKNNQKWSIVHNRVNILNHQLGEKNKLNVVKTSGVSRGESKPRLNKLKANKFDWKTTCNDLKKAIKIIQGTDTSGQSILDELKYNPLEDSILKL